MHNAPSEKMAYSRVEQSWAKESGCAVKQELCNFKVLWEEVGTIFKCRPAPILQCCHDSDGVTAYPSVPLSSSPVGWTEALKQAPAAGSQPAEACLVCVQRVLFKRGKG